jgi:hypothetical protein
MINLNCLIQKRSKIELDPRIWAIPSRLRGYFAVKEGALVCGGRRVRRMGGFSRPVLVRT